MSPRDGGVAARTLTDPGVVKVITKMLRDQGVPAWDLEDARQDVYAKALKAIRRGRAPAETEEMKNFCVKIAEEHAIDLLRKADVRALVVVDDCRPEELVPLRSSGVQRDPVDASSRCSLSSFERRRCRQTASTSSRAWPAGAPTARLRSISESNRIWSSGVCTRCARSIAGASSRCSEPP